MEFDWNKAKEVFRKHVVENKNKIAKELQDLRDKSSRDLEDSFKRGLEDIMKITPEDIEEANRVLMQQTDLQKEFSQLSEKPSKYIGLHLRSMEGEGALQVIRCKCGEAFAGCVHGLQDDGWYKSAVDYVKRGCTVSIEDPTPLSSCSCIKTGQDAIGFGDFIHEHFQMVDDENDVVKWVEPSSEEEFSTEALYELYKKRNK